MILEVEENIIRPAKGSKIPSDVEDLVARLNRAMPKELFDPNEHAMDTTYVDTDLRIVRMTGPKRLEINSKPKATGIEEPKPPYLHALKSLFFKSLPSSAKPIKQVTHFSVLAVKRSHVITCLSL